MYELGPDNGSLTLHTARAGFAARAGHDLVIEAERWSASIRTAQSSPEQLQLCASVDATSLRVREGNGGVKPLTDNDREEIRRNLEHKILKVHQHPEITFMSRAVHVVNDRRWQITGELTIAGAPSTISFPIEIASAADGTRMSSCATVTQSDFGIKPFTAMMGALKVADDVEIRADLLVPAHVKAS